MKATAKGTRSLFYRLRKSSTFHILVIVIAAIFLRVLFLLGMDLTVDETHNWAWSRNLDWGYYDNSPMVAWIMALTFLPGALGLRLPFVLIGAIPIVFSALIAGQLTKDKKAPVVAALLTATLPMLVLAGSLALYDGPQIALYTCATALALSARGKRWLTTGFVWGLAMLAKWGAALLAPSLVLSAVVDTTLRKQLRTPWPYLGVLIGLLVFSPFLIWNSQHDFISFTFFYGQRMSARPTPRSLLDALILGPGPIVLAIALIGFALEKTPQWRRLAFVTNIPIVLVIILAFRGRVDPNWLDFIYPGMCAAAAVKLVAMRKVGIVVTATIVIPWIVWYLIHASEIRQPRLISPTFPYIERLHGWPKLAQDLAEYKNDYIIPSNYAIASELSYYGGFQNIGPTFHKDSQWSIWNKQPQPGQRKVFISQTDPSQADKERLKIVGKEPKIYESSFSGRVIRRLWVYLPE